MKKTRTVSESIAKTFLFFAFACISTVWAAEGEAPLKVPYLDENGKTQYCEDPIELNNDTDISDTLPGGCYVVMGKVSYTNPLKFKAPYDETIRLILADGAELSVDYSEKKAFAITAWGNMAINTQSTGENMGKLSAASDSGYAGIELFNKSHLTINGGIITATSYYIGIYANKLTINGGSITATSNKEDGLSAEKLTINAGTVIATSKNYDGISTDSMTINGGSVTATGNNHGIYSKYHATINGGTIIATGNTNDGIEVYLDSITINGGTITATGNTDGLKSFRSTTINGGTITAIGGKAFEVGGMIINKGNVIAKGGHYGFSTTTLSINGGNVTATVDSCNNSDCKSYGLYAFHNININGGNVTASGAYGFYAEDSIFIGYSSASDSIKASSYKIGHNYGCMNIVEGKAITDGEGNGYIGQLTDDELSAIAGKTLKPGYMLTFVTNDINTVVHRQGVTIGKTPTEPNPLREDFELAGWYTDKKFENKFDFSKPLEKDMTLYAKWKNLVNVTYIDEKGKTQQLSEYSYLKDTTYLNDTLPGGWYLFKGKMIDTIQLKFKGDVHLVLADSAKLSTAPLGIDVNGNLTIYVQSTGDQMGKLAVGKLSSKNNFTINGGDIQGEYGFYAEDDIIINGGNIITKKGGHGLYAEDSVIINGGTISVSTSNGSTDIYSDGAIYAENGNVTINDGSISAYGGHKGIMTLYGNITINGGRVYADGRMGGIHTGRGNVTINGGHITATGYDAKVGIFGADRDGIEAEEGSIIINGGSVDASCNYGSSLTAYGDIIINAGSVVASESGRGLNGINSDHGNIILGYCSMTDSIVSYKYYAPEGKVIIAKGLAFKDKYDSVYSDTLKNLKGLANLVLRPAYASTSCSEKNSFTPIAAGQKPKIIYANGQLTISTPRASNVKVEIFDLMGNLVTKSIGYADIHTVSLTHLKRGVYMARVTADHAMHAQRFQVK